MNRPTKANTAIWPQSPWTSPRSFISASALLWVVSIPFHAAASPISGLISQDTTWSGLVEVVGDVAVEPEATLTIMPGTQVQFAASSSVYDHPLGTPGLCDLIVYGALVARGGASPSDSILFQSSSTSPAPGHWGTIRVLNTAVNAAFDHAAIRHATTGLQIEGSHTTVDYCLIARNANCGLRWTNPALPQVLTGIWFSENGGDGFYVSGADSIALRACRFLSNGLAGFKAEGLHGASADSCIYAGNGMGCVVSAVSRGFDVMSCTFTGNGSGLTASGGGLVTIAGASFAGPTDGVTVAGSGRTGGVWLTGSTVSGAVVATGSGVVAIEDNPSLASVSVTATSGTDTLTTSIRRNVVAGTIAVNAISPTWTVNVHQAATIAGNQAPMIRLYALGGMGSGGGYLTAVVDSNQVTGSSGDRIQLEAGAVDPNNLHYYGWIDATVSRNTLTGGANGIDAYLGQGWYANTAGYIKLTSTGDGITGATRGVRLSNVAEVSLQGDVITGCGTGVVSERWVDGVGLSMRSCRVTGNTVQGLNLSDVGATLGGSLGEANDIYGNTGQNLVTTALVNAGYNYWGTTDEDSVVSLVTGPVNYTPWTDASHSGVYASTYKRGVISGEEHWGSRRRAHRNCRGLYQSLAAHS